MAADLINEGPIQLKEQLMDELWHLEFHIWKEPWKTCIGCMLKREQLFVLMKGFGLSTHVTVWHTYLLSRPEQLFNNQSLFGRHVVTQ